MNKVDVQYIFSVNKTKPFTVYSMIYKPSLLNGDAGSPDETNIIRLERKWSTRNLVREMFNTCFIDAIKMT